MFLSKVVTTACLFLLSVSTGFGGKGNKGPKAPREVPATATFVDLIGVSGIEGDGQDGQVGQSSYVDGELDGGWAHFVANGNFTLRTYGNSKKKNSEPRKLEVTLSPPLPTKIGPAFLAVNDSLCESGSCPPDDFNLLREGGLRDMAPGEKIFVQITGRMADPDRPNYTILWRCGPEPRSDGGVDYEDTEFFEATCENSDSQGTCVQWKVAPPPPPEGEPAVMTRKCAVLEEDDSGNRDVILGSPADVGIDLVIDRH